MRSFSKSSSGLPSAAVVEFVFGVFWCAAGFLAAFAAFSFSAREPGLRALVLWAPVVATVCLLARHLMSPRGSRACLVAFWCLAVVWLCACAAALLVVTPTIQD